jgi:5'-nucleotidase
VANEHRQLHLNADSSISHEPTGREKEARKEIRQWKAMTRKVLRRSSKAHYQNTISVTAKEHMSSVDCFDGKEARSGMATNEVELTDEDLITVNPAVDGRLKDIGRKE